MPLLSDAKTCLVGQTQIKQIYAGTQLVWPKGPDDLANMQYLVHCDQAGSASAGVRAYVGNLMDPNKSVASKKIAPDGKFGNCFYCPSGIREIEGQFRNTSNVLLSTVDMWFKLDGDIRSNHQEVLTCWTSGNGAFILNYRSGEFSLVTYTGSTFECGAIATPDDWHHIGITVKIEPSEITYSVWIDGKTNATEKKISGTGSDKVIYYTAGSNQQFQPNYYIDEFRISEGIRYTADFTPPDQPYYPPDP